MKEFFYKKEKIILLIFSIFSVFISILEVFNLGIIIPFINIVNNSEKLLKFPLIFEIMEKLNIKKEKIIVIIGIIIISISILKLIVITIYNIKLSSFLNKIYLRLTKTLLKKIMKMPYSEYLKENKSELIKLMIYETDKLNIIIKDIMIIISEIIIAVLLLLTMFFLNRKIFLFISIFSGISLLCIKLLILDKIKKIGIVKNKMVSKCFFSLEIIFENIKALKILFSEKENSIIENYYINTDKCLENEKKWNVLFPLSKQIFETLGIVLIILIIIFLCIESNNENKKILEILIIFVVALYRLLPSIYRIVSAIQEVLYYKNAFIKIKQVLNYYSEKEGNLKISYNKSILIENLDFLFNNEKIFRISFLEILKGERIGIVGVSGSGKSTFINVLLGMYREKLKNIRIDDKELSDKNIRDWYKKISYIPQEIILFDGTVADNIVFGRKYDQKKLENAIKLSRLDKIFSNYNYVVGDKGNLLSGGQRQRIVIARALYDEPEILILDEATSSLDEKTEREIMEEIYNLNKNLTILLITHRKSVLYGCDKILNFCKGKNIEIKVGELNGK